MVKNIHFVMWAYILSVGFFCNSTEGNTREGGANVSLQYCAGST